jgi:hypothetical protein
MEWFEQVLDSYTVKEDKLNREIDLYSLKFDWVEINLKKGIYKLIITNGNEIKGFINIYKAIKRSVTSILFNKKYIIKKTGLMNRRILIREQNHNEQLVLSLTKNTKDSELFLPDGEKIYWKHSCNSNNEWIFIDQNDNKLLQFNLEKSFLSSGFNIIIKDKKLYQKTVLLLVVTGIFNLIQSTK